MWQRGSPDAHPRSCDVQISTRRFSFMLPPSEIPPSPRFPYRTDPSQSLTWPYNLPAEAIGYDEFWNRPPHHEIEKYTGHIAPSLGFEEMDESSESSDDRTSNDNDSQEEDDDEEESTSPSEVTEDEDEEEEEEEEDEEDEDEDEDQDQRVANGRRPRRRQLATQKIRLKVKSRPRSESDLSSVPSSNTQDEEERGTRGRNHARPTRQQTSKASRVAAKGGKQPKGKPSLPSAVARGRRGKVKDDRDLESEEGTPQSGSGAKAPRKGKTHGASTDLPKSKALKLGDGAVAQPAADSDTGDFTPSTNSRLGIGRSEITNGAIGDSTTAASSSFYITELVESGRPGHLNVNVPIPPSGSGPRPPPGPLIGLDGKLFIGPEPIKPTLTFASIIHRALTYLPRGRGTLGEVCNWVAGEWEWFRMNVDSGWQHSIRHNLSLSKLFLKVDRIPEDDPESKGSVWVIDPVEGPLFEAKLRKDAQKNAAKGIDPSKQQEREQQKTEERARKARELAHLQTRPSPPVRQAVAVKRPLVKAPVTVVIVTLTPEIRAQASHKAHDESGNAIPWACDGSTLFLDTSTFSNLDENIKKQLSVLGADGAVAALTNWLTVRNKAAKNANGKTGLNAADSTPNGVASAAKAQSTAIAAAKLADNTASQSPPPAPNQPVVNGNASPAAGSVVKGETPTAANGARTDLSHIISQILAVTNARGDIKTVGPHAPALLRYIRHIGIKIDKAVAMRVWESGILPPDVPTKAMANGIKRKAEEEAVEAKRVKVEASK